MGAFLSRLSRVAVVLGLCAGAAAVPVGGAAPAWSDSAGCRSPAPAAVAGFFDGALPGGLRREGVPGAVVSVVSGGRTVFAKGYGLADVARGVGFDASRSLVRIASITKLFTWTAVMQQVQAGRLDLDVDVNRYLRTFTIPATFAAPVTLRTLMGHTAGFEDRFVGTGARTAAEVPPLGEYLAAHVPARVRPPGEVSAYSNYGAALAGYIVSQVSGEPFDRYVQRHLLDPLKMGHSTAAEPVPGPLAADLARSYLPGAVPVPFTFDPMTPDGSISATAADMAHFMIAHLGGGRFGDAAILDPATAALMFQRSSGNDPRLGGYAHGFQDRVFNGHRVLMHDGGWEGFLSVLMLVPGCDLGVFVSVNGVADAGLQKVIDGFFDRFAPAGAVPDSPGPVPPPGTRPAAPLAGLYERTRHGESTIEKILVLLGPARVAVRGDGVVRFQDKDWSPQADGAYALADGSDRLVFLSGAGGRRYVATDRGSAFELMSVWRTPAVNLPVLLVFAVVALSVLAVPVAGVWRRARRRPVRTGGAWRVARWLGAGACGAGLGFLVALGVWLSGDTDGFLFGAPVGFRVLFVVPVVVLAMAGAAAVLTVRGWRGPGAGVVARVHQVVVLAGLSGLVWFLWQWNLIGWRF
ncbi:serine hydrolase domain-containing protein [Sphaerisporangium corydalis]|uniref:Serine hydrolase domain-containing protein n=1 Tax=Sphaerisporangium corydalis TaxID=1441875 RepID=A0ABV9EE28_9ACTN